MRRIYSKLESEHYLLLEPVVSSDNLGSRGQYCSLPSMSRTHILVFLFLWAGCTNRLIDDRASSAFEVTIVDRETNQGIPMVELKLLNALVFHADNDGHVRIDAPDLQDAQHYFEIKSPGYRYGQDETGRASVVLNVRGASDTTLYMDRTQHAERLYRITGSGRQVHHEKASVREVRPVSGILGQDSNLALPFDGKILWIWGDTFLPGAYKGNFSVAGAWSSDPRIANWSPANGIPFNHVVNNTGRSRPMIQLEGPGYVWLDWLMSIPDESNQKILLAKYARVDAYFGNYERGLATYSPGDSIFIKLKETPEWLSALHTCQHPTPVLVGEKEYYYLFDAFNFSRVERSLDHATNPDKYEELVFEFSTSQDAEIFPLIWQSHEAVSQQRLPESDSAASQAEGKLHALRDLVTGEQIEPGRGSVTWNPFRKRWICIWGNKDIWYTEAETPVGPWVYARKVAEHQHFFYNPVHHAFLDEEGGRRIYFEGTFTKFFSPEPPIPRYEYNQIMYGLSLDRPDMILPQPIFYQQDLETPILRSGYLLDEQEKSSSTILCYAPDRPGDEEALIPIFDLGNGKYGSQSKSVKNNKPVFYGINAAYQKENRYVGNWEGKINYRSFDNYVSLELNRSGGQWNIRSNNPAMQLSEVQIDGSELSFDLLYRESRYRLMGEVFAGKIDGQFTNLKSQSTGTFNLELITVRPWIWDSPDLVPLWRCEQPDGSYSYTVKAQTANTCEVICLVWKNPLNARGYDYGAKSATF